jgi:hypothetical protein
MTISIAWPRLGSNWFAYLERKFLRLAQKRLLAVVSVGFSAVLLRLALLPLFPIPEPVIPDEFSYLLAANTFATGRLTNPTPAMWKHFESIQISMQPTYMSMYFPGQGMILAMGKVLFGHPWFGQLLITGLMCSAVCWMLQAWLPANWALLGGYLAVFRIGLFSFWINTYVGSGSIAALGGALVLGAFPRFMRLMRLRDGILLAIGILIVAVTRPYEGLFLCVPVAFSLGRRMLFGKDRPAFSVLARRIAIPLTLMVAGASWMGYYDYRVFENPLILPYVLHRATYAVAPTFTWQKPRPQPVYRHQSMKDFYTRNELEEFEKVRSVRGFFGQNTVKLVRAFQFFAGFALLPPLIMIGRVLKDRRLRFIITCTLLLMAGMLAEAALFAYYLAPFTTAFFLIGLQAMRHLRQWKPRGKPVGGSMVRAIVLVTVAMAVIQVSSELARKGPGTPRSAWSCPAAELNQCGTLRANLNRELSSLRGQQLVLVRYGANHNPLNEWVYNDPDIDDSKVVWAHEMESASNQELLEYYKDRKAWLVQPDLRPIRVAPYPVPEHVTVGSSRPVCSSQPGK